jgi:hypothetical protein
VVARQAEVERSSSDHVALTSACKNLEEAQKLVETLYHRWQELEARRTGGN